ncbi:MAG: ACT domain-containing protein [Gemmatimonadales bacterium]
MPCYLTAARNQEPSLTTHFATDLTVTLQADRPGALAAAIEAIAKAGINLDGYAEFEGTLHVLTHDAPATQRALRAVGIRVRGERQVIVIGVDDRPGVAAQVFRRIADAGINVDFSYVANQNRMVIGADDPTKIADVVK